MEDVQSLSDEDDSDDGSDSISHHAAYSSHGEWTDVEDSDSYSEPEEIISQNTEQTDVEDFDIEDLVDGFRGMVIVSDHSDDEEIDFDEEPFLGVDVENDRNTPGAAVRNYNIFTYSGRV